MPAGLLIVDKPPGWTSFDVVAVLRGLLGAARVGHGGTLDPAATGVLAVLVGTATKQAALLHTAEKAYAAVIRFGAETATDDAEGEVTATGEVPELDDAAIERLLASERGTRPQVPPAYAAIKVNGRHAYDRARAGERVELAPREVTIARLEAASWRAPELRVLVVCTGGTYVRSIARDLGRACGSRAHLRTLRRLAVGGLTIDEAAPLEPLRASGRDAARARLRPLGAEDIALPPRFREQEARALLGDWQAS